MALGARGRSWSNLCRGIDRSEGRTVNLVRVGKIIVNLDLAIDILPGDAAGPDPGSLTVHFVDDREHTFTGDDAEGLRAYLERTAKNAKTPQKDLEIG
jgi:hypothetical protein